MLELHWFFLLSAMCVGLPKALLYPRITCIVTYGTKLFRSFYCASFLGQDLKGNCHIIVSRKVDLVTLEVDSHED